MAAEEGNTLTMSGENRRATPSDETDALPATARHAVKQMGTQDTERFTVWCVCGHESVSIRSPLEAVDIHAEHIAGFWSGSPTAIDALALAADLRAAASSGVLMPEFGSDAVTSLTRWADLLAPGSPEAGTP